jgi:hypothetical protein
VGEVGEVRVSDTLTASTELAAPPHPTLRATFSPWGRRGGWRKRLTTSLFSPTGRRCRQADERATRATFTYGETAKSHRPTKVTPLCPAGHLPHKGGDRLDASARSDLNVQQCHRNDSISPPVGEMSGRTEGGIAATEPAAPSSGCRHLLPAGEKRLVAGRSLPLPFSPTGGGRTGRDQRLGPGQWPEGSDEGAPHAGSKRTDLPTPRAAA